MTPVPRRADLSRVSPGARPATNHLRGTGGDARTIAASSTTRLGPAERAPRSQALAGTELDVLVVGGGVVGAGVALDAATRGLTVGLVEARDCGSGTSQPVEQADPRRPALSGDARLRPGPRGAERARRCCCSGSPRTWSTRSRSCSRSPTTAGSGPTSAPASSLYDTLGFSWARPAACPATGT